MKKIEYFFFKCEKFKERTKNITQQIEENKRLLTELRRLADEIVKEATDG